MYIFVYYVKPSIRASTSTRWQQALADKSRSAICCHSNETHSPIANLPNSAQLEGIPTIPPSYIRVPAVVWEFGRRQTDSDTQTDTEIRVTNVHFASSTGNVKTLPPGECVYIFSNIIIVILYIVSLDGDLHCLIISLLAWFIVNQLLECWNTRRCRIAGATKRASSSREATDNEDTREVEDHTDNADEACVTTTALVT